MPNFQKWPGHDPSSEFLSDHYALKDCVAPRWWPPGSTEIEGTYTAIAETITDGTLDCCVNYKLFPNAKVEGSISPPPNSIHPSHNMTEEQLPMKHIEQKVMKNDEAYHGLNRIACYVFQKRKRSEAGELRRRLPKKARQHFDAYIDNRWAQRHDCDRELGSYRRGRNGRGGGSSGRDGARKARGRGHKGSARSFDSNQSNRVTEYEGATSNSASKVRFGAFLGVKPKWKSAPRREGGKGNAHKRSQRTN